MTVVAAFLAVTFAAAGAASPVSKSAMRATAPSRIDSEASFEYLVGLAGSLAKGDTSDQLGVLKAQLDALLLQKKALLTRAAEIQKQAAAVESAGDRAKAQSLLATIATLQESLGKVDVQIQALLDEIRTLQQNEERQQDEAKRAADTLKKFEAALLEDPPRDAYVKTLSPAARQSALPKTRHGLDGIATLIRVAAAKAAEANAAAQAAAEKQRQLVEQQKHLRDVESKLQRYYKEPIPTPTRSVLKGVSTVK